jgi:hypothetical protein
MAAESAASIEALEALADAGITVDQTSYPGHEGATVSSIAAAYRRHLFALCDETSVWARDLPSASAFGEISGTVAAPSAAPPPPAAAAVPPTPASDFWSCPSCTFHNSLELASCEICEAERPMLPPPSGERVSAAECMLASPPAPFVPSQVNAEDGLKALAVSFATELDKVPANLAAAMERAASMRDEIIAAAVSRHEILVAELTAASAAKTAALEAQIVAAGELVLAYLTVQ